MAGLATGRWAILLSGEGHCPGQERAALTDAPCPVCLLCSPNSRPLGLPRGCLWRGGREQTQLLAPGNNMPHNGCRGLEAYSAALRGLEEGKHPHTARSPHSAKECLPQSWLPQWSHYELSHCWEKNIIVLREQYDHEMITEPNFRNKACGK